MKKALLYLLATILTGFGLLTLFLSISVIFDLFGIRAKEGNYVLFVVWSNFISSILYLISSYGFVTSKKWTAKLLGVSTIILIIALIGLFYHINSGGIYETKTVGAMIFRITVTLAFSILAYLTITKTKKMKRKLISLLTVSMFLFSCGNHSHEGTTTQTDTTAYENHHHGEDSKTIELNNGEKWKVNDEMMVHVRAMGNEINTFKGKELADYKTLAAKLGEYNNSLISSCTMKGKSHDELHVWLLPHIDLTDKLLKAGNETEAAKGLEDIRTSMKTFNQYFQ